MTDADGQSGRGTFGHLAIAIELGALVQHQARRDERATQPRRWQQFDSLAGDDLACDAAADCKSNRRNARGYHGTWCDQNLIACNLAFGFALDSGRFLKVQFAGDSRSPADARFEVPV
jgi:hypothetical protein